MNSVIKLSSEHSLNCEDVSVDVFAWDDCEVHIDVGVPEINIV